MARDQLVRLGLIAMYQKFDRNSSHQSGFMHGNVAPCSPSASTNGATICLLDDDLSMLKATSRMLSFAGCRVQSFTDPITFLDYARDHQPRVVVLDILMPAMNGLQVQNRLREISPWSRVIILTSKDDSLVRAKAMGAGAFAFFPKPVNDEHLLARIASALNGNQNGVNPKVQA